MPNLPVSGPVKRDFHLPARQPYARDNERRSHTEALFGFGERAMFVLMWHYDDLAAGRIGRCQRCVAGAGATRAAAEAVFDAYKQPSESKCPACFGTTFEGGWKARIIRPAIFIPQGDEDQQQGTRGLIDSHSAQVQSTSDFHARRGDYAFRADGTRWQLQGTDDTKLIDGFGTPSRVDSNLGVSISRAIREDRASAAYLIPPTNRQDLSTLLERVGGHFRVDYTAHDEIRGPLMAEAHNAEPIDYRPYDGLPGTDEVKPWP